MNNPTPGVSLNSSTLAEVATDVLVISIGQGAKPGERATRVDEALSGLISKLIEAGAFRGKAFEFEWISPSPIKARRVLLVGSGPPDRYNLRVLRLIAGAASRQAQAKGARSVCLALDYPPGESAQRCIEAGVDGALTSLWGSDLYKARSEKARIEQVQVWAPEGAAAAEQALERGLKLATAVNFARWLGDEPSNVMTPVRLAEEAQRMAKDNGLDFEALDEEAINAAGMGSLLSVSKGSQYPPRVVVLSYKEGGDSPTLGLVGKGVTFDTGGISIKPAADMHYMKYDMCGAATVIATVYALALLKAPVNVIGVAGLVENMPSGTATRPGDVVKAANGKTIEIVNTDAEGRLVLADALDLARKRGAERLVDVATLTGAIKVALGELVSGLMSNRQQWAGQLLQAASEAGERLWQMPLYPEYFDKLKSNIADMMNSDGRNGGAEIAAAFLQQFVGNTSWAHLDIAGTAYTEKDHAWQAKGATGVMIRTLIRLAESQGQNT